MTNTSALEAIDRLQPHKNVVEIAQYSILQGSADGRIARDLYYANQSGMRLKSRHHL